MVQLQSLLGHFVFALLATVVQPLLPAIQQKYDLSIFQSSLIPTTYTVFMTLTNIAVGIGVSKFGVRKPYFGALGLGVIASILIGFAGSYPVLLGSFALLGVSVGTAFTTLSTAYAHLPTKYKNFGLFHGAFGVGGMAAPLILAVVLSFGLGYESIFGVFVVLLILSIGLLVQNRAFEHRSAEALSLHGLGKAVLRPVFFLGILGMGMYAGAETGSIVFSGNLQGRFYGLELAQNSFLLSLFWVGFTLSRFATDPLLDRLGLRWILVFSAWGAALVLLLWVLGFGFWIFPLSGLFMGPVFPAIQKFVNDQLPDEEKGLFNGAAYGSLGLFISGTLPIMGSRAEVGITSAYVVSIGMFGVLGIIGFVLGQRQFSQSKTP
ncbi:MAG: MFS transporter [Spirochaetales bacterium]|nr:MFS transporter [Spirochaetales bacterium]